MKNDLIERYLYAVTKRMNPKIREDVKNELSCLIEDMLMERCGDVVPTEKDIRVVLTELGTPQELYAKYADDADQCLIGQPYYSAYKYILKIVLGGVLVGCTIVCLILQLLEPQNLFAALEKWIEMTSEGLVSGFALITILYAFYQRKGIKMESYNLDELPAVPNKKEEISRTDCIFSIGACVVLMVLLLAAPEYLIGYWGPEGVIPLFDSAVLGKCWYLLLIFGTMEISRSAVRLMEGSYNKKVLIVSLVTNCIGALSAILMLTRPDLVNPEFVTHVKAVFVDEPDFIRNIFIHFQPFLLTVILIAFAADTAKTIIKYLKK